eukprot:4593081-Pleurochrysis_carterae.AAC.1
MPTYGIRTHYAKTSHATGSKISSVSPRGPRPAPPSSYRGRRSARLNSVALQQFGIHNSQYSYKCEMEIAIRRPRARASTAISTHSSGETLKVQSLYECCIDHL